MSHKHVLTGNHAAAHACKDARVEVIAAYPITPQSPVTERISEFVASGDLSARYVCVESEHTAITVCIGAASTNARTFTATSANGLCLMHELLHWAAGARLPIVMACVNRGMAAPWTIWTDHQDSMSQRDTGWIQIYVEDNQEIYDSILQAYRLAERMLLPVMVCYDGYMLSHTAMPVITAEQAVVDEFLPHFELPVKLDPDRPVNVGLVTLPEPRQDHPGIAEFGGYMEIRHDLQKDLTAAIAEVGKVDAEFKQAFGRSYKGIMKTYKTDGAKLVIMTMGTVASEARVAVDLLSERGLEVGVASLRLYRPFPTEAIRQLAEKYERIMIIDRALSYGNEGPLAGDVKAALYSSKNRPEINCFVAGLGGREISAGMIAEAAEKVYKGQAEQPGRPQEMPWINLQPARSTAAAINELRGQ
ncbi:MAG: transketolase C-terminal domain-containing protein [Planctomycetota bacterium]|jgi:pyruvate ferredoxin oxidoreductase alpha subunit